MHLLCFLTVTPRILKAMTERQSEFTNFKRVQIAVGTWNVNGGKQFRTNLLGTAELTDWLLDAPRLSGAVDSQGENGNSGKAKQGGLPTACHSSLALHAFWGSSLPFSKHAEILWSRIKRQDGCHL